MMVRLEDNIMKKDDRFFNSFNSMMVRLEETMTTVRFHRNEVSIP